jgi:2,4-dienoyl-CoA reductase-like NADH-dependent reductase (Old Yellow Enzyme family)
MTVIQYGQLRRRRVRRSCFNCGSGDAKRLGFDVVEIHGAHGYLIYQFFRTATNIRDDRSAGRR